jgi:hypothetical protein
MGPAIGGAAAVTAANAAHASHLIRRRREKEEYNEIKANLDEIVEQGEDRPEFFVDTNVSTLPEYQQGIFDRLLRVKKQYRRPEESVEDYLARVFETFNLFFNEDEDENVILVAQYKELSLEFEVDEELVDKRRERIVLFEPKYTELPRIEVEMEVRRQKVTYRYESYVEDDITFDLEQIDPAGPIHIGHRKITNLAYKRAEKRFMRRNKLFSRGMIAAAALIIGLPIVIFWHQHFAGKNAKTFVTPVSYTIEKHDVDQVFRDHNKYRLYFDNEQEEIIEKMYMDKGITSDSHHGIPFPIIDESEMFRGLEAGGKHVKIFRDLEKGAQGYTNVIHYKVNAHAKCGHWFDKDDPLYYVEIHLPAGQKIAPGEDRWETGSGKHHKTHNQPIEEVR